MNNLKNTIAQLVANTTTGATIVSVDSVTDPKMKKTGNPYSGKVMKHQTLVGIVGFDYERCVNRLALKEGAETREAKPRTWGTITEDKIFVEHKDKSYLRMKVQRSLNKKYIHIETGEEIAEEDLKAWLPKPKKSSTQSDLKGEVIERDISLDNLTSVKMMGEQLIK